MRKFITAIIFAISLSFCSCSADWCKQADNYALATADFLSNRWQCQDRDRLGRDLIWPLDQTVCVNHPYTPKDIRIAASLICEAAVQFMAIAGGFVIADRYKCNFISVYSDLAMAGTLCSILLPVAKSSIEQSYYDVVQGNIKWEHKPTAIDYSPAWELTCITSDCSDTELIIHR